MNRQERIARRELRATKKIAVVLVKPADLIEYGKSRRAFDQAATPIKRDLMNLKKKYPNDAAHIDKILNDVRRVVDSLYDIESDIKI